MEALPAGKLSDKIAAYVEEKTGAHFDPGMFQAFMVVNDNKDFVAAVIISNFRKTDCEVTCVSESPAAWRPHVCQTIFSYIFEYLGCARCTCITTKGNKKSRSFLINLGFELEGRLRQGFDGCKDALVYGLLASECRFLAGYKGKSNGGITELDGVSEGRAVACDEPEGECEPVAAGSY